MEDIRTACFIGAGYVGALTAVVLALKNPTIQFYIVDKDAGQISAWNSDNLPIFEPGLEEIFFEEENGERRRKLTNVVFSTEINECIHAAEMVFLCVDTPAMTSPDSDDIKGLNLRNLEAAVKSIAQAATGHKIIVQKSTAPCGTVRWMWDTLKKAAAPSASFDLLSNPEFLAQGSAIDNLLQPNRVVIGNVISNDPASQSKSLSALKNLYSWVPPDRIITTDVWSAELGKIASNAFIAQRISSINSISAICEATNANIHDISTIVGSEPRVGPKSLRAGFGFGGSCLRKDIACLIYLARELGLFEVADYWRAVIRMNDYQNRRIAERVVQCLPPPLEAQTVAILGFSFKKDTIDTRNSTAVDVIRDLVKRGINIHIYDPRVPRGHIERALQSLDYTSAKVTITDSIDTACTGCSAIILHTDWEEFNQETACWKHILDRMHYPKLLLDPSMLLDHLAIRNYGFNVLEVGRRHQTELN